MTETRVATATAAAIEKPITLAELGKVNWERDFGPVMTQEEFAKDYEWLLTNPHNVKFDQNTPAIEILPPEFGGA